MKFNGKNGILILLACCFMVVLSSCSSGNGKSSSIQVTEAPTANAAVTSVNETESKPAAETTAAPTATAKKTSSSSVAFTNKYGTATTICAHPGCTNTIAASGDTNCCTVHSRKCLACGKYIDEDAMYCMDCITKAATGSSSSSSYSSSSSGYGSSSSGYGSGFSNAYGSSTTKCAHPGCNNPIASSGDTNCCTKHSRKCLQCGKYIDEDAMYCMSCILSAFGN